MGKNQPKSDKTTADNKKPAEEKKSLPPKKKFTVTDKGKKVPAGSAAAKK